jgi:hypothetical protein
LTFSRPGVSAVPFPGGIGLLDEPQQRIHIGNEMAGAMWRLLCEGWSEQDIAESLAEHFALPAERVAHDLANALAAWTEAGLIAGEPEAASPPDAPPSETPIGGKFRRNRYALLGFAFELAGAEPRVLDQLEATLEAYRADRPPPRCKLEIGVAAPPEPFVLSEDGCERMRTATRPEMVGGVYQCLHRRVHHHAEWMAHNHGAAVRCADGRAVLLPGEGGSGKSTLAAWLSRRGFGFLADDMIALDCAGRVVPWPLPHSIKRGSWAPLAGVFPELDVSPSRIVNGREIKFVSASREAWDAAPAPARAVIFPSYDTRAEPGLAPLTLVETVERLFGGRMWLGERLTPARIEAFLRWLEPIPAYSLRYAKLAEAEAFVRSAIA